MALVDTRAELLSTIIAPRGNKFADTTLDWFPRWKNGNENPPFKIRLNNLDYYPEVLTMVADSIAEHIKNSGREINCIGGVFPFGSRFSGLVAEKLDLPEIIVTKSAGVLMSGGSPDTPTDRLALVDDFMVWGGACSRVISQLTDKKYGITVPLVVPIIFIGPKSTRKHFTKYGNHIEPLFCLADAETNTEFQARSTQWQLFSLQQWRNRLNNITSIPPIP